MDEGLAVIDSGRARPQARMNGQTQEDAVSGVNPGHRL